MCNNDISWVTTPKWSQDRGDIPPTCTTILPWRMQFISTTVMSLICCLAMAVTLKAEPVRIDKEFNHSVISLMESKSLHFLQFPTVLVNLHCSAIERILTYCIRGSKEWSTQCSRSLTVVTKDFSHSTSHLFDLLPPRRHCSLSKSAPTHSGTVFFSSRHPCWTQTPPTQTHASVFLKPINNTHTKVCTSPPHKSIYNTEQICTFEYSGTCRCDDV